MNKKYSRFWIGMVFVIAISLASNAVAQDEPKREITQIAGDLYRFQNNFHVSVFLVTPDGIIATDPINADAAQWLKAELTKRFNLPIKYVIYSHDHSDHISGGEVFADTAVVVAHENARRAIIGEKRPTAIPEVTFSDRLTIELGGKTVELIYVGRSHSDNTIVLHFPAERALFTVDIITVKRLPYQNFPDSYFPDWIEALKMVETIDFDILVPGHGPLGTKADASDNRAYLEDLYTAVLEQARVGASLEEMQQNITLEKYQDWGQYEAWLPLNIEGVYQRIMLQRRGS